MAINIINKHDIRLAGRDHITAVSRRKHEYRT